MDFDLAKLLRSVRTGGYSLGRDETQNMFQTACEPTLLLLPLILLLRLIFLPRLVPLQKMPVIQLTLAEASLTSVPSEMPLAAE